MSRFSVFLALLMVVLNHPAMAQGMMDASTGVASSNILDQIDMVGKALGAVVTALAALIGLPIVFMTYRKTRVEITKLELEANALRGKQEAELGRSKDVEGNIMINIEHSPGVNVKVLADPRFLAPLLLLLDFIFAWVVLMLADRLFDLFVVGIVRSGVLTVLAAVLLLPIAKQVLRVRAVLRPPQSDKELRASLRQARIAGYTSYILCMTTAIGFGVFVLLTLSPGGSTQVLRMLSWASIATGVLMLLLVLPLKRRFNRYIELASK